MTQKQNLGSRQTRHDLLQEAISKHNRQAVGKARVNPDETSALYVFDQAPQSVRRLLKVIWGTEVPPVHSHHSGLHCFASFQSRQATVGASSSPAGSQPIVV